jgi:hypothetical protein
MNRPHRRTDRELLDLIHRTPWLAHFDVSRRAEGPVGPVSPPDGSPLDLIAADAHGDRNRSMMDGNPPLTRT